MRVLDLFSAAAGGWSLGLHRAGFETVAACEWIEWRRALYAENNPGVLIYDDVRTLTGERLLADLGALPDIVVGSPPCQDISSANTKGKGVDGERSGLFFEAIRIIGEVRPRWVALENSANLRTRGADRVLGELEGQGYACWAIVVGGDTVGANHERKRSWIIGCDVEQLGDAAEDGRGSGFSRGCAGATDEPEQSPRGHDVHATRLGHEGGRSRRHGPDGDGAASVAGGSSAPDACSAGHSIGQGQPVDLGSTSGSAAQRDDAAGGRDGGGLGSAGCIGQMGLRPTDRVAAFEHRADWSLDDLARHIRMDDGLPAWVAEQRIAVGGPRGTSAASLIVEAFGDAVLPQIPEAIGRAILRTEAALSAVYHQKDAA